MTRRTIETTLGRVERVSAEQVEIRISPGVRLSTESFAATREARRELAEGRPMRVLMLLPEELDFQLDVMQVDHYKGTSAEEYTKALAIVSPETLYERLAELYFAYHPPSFPVRIFTHEADAQAWLDQQA